MIANSTVTVQTSALGIMASVRKCRQADEIADDRHPFARPEEGGRAARNEIAHHHGQRHDQRHMADDSASAPCTSERVWPRPEPADAHGGGIVHRDQRQQGATACGSSGDRDSRRTPARPTPFSGSFSGSRTMKKIATALSSVIATRPSMTSRQPNASAAAASGEAPITFAGRAKTDQPTRSRWPDGPH